MWRARAISRETHDLSVEAVAFADRLICATPSKIGLVDAARLVQEARLYFDPDRAIADEEHELTRRGVWLRHRGNPATTDVVMTLDTPDALLFDQTVTRIAGELAPARRHRPGRRPPGTSGRDPRRPPVRPGPHVRPRSAAPTAGAGAAEPLRAPRPRPARCRRPSRSSAPPPPAARRLAHPVRRSRRQGHRPTRPRPRPTRPRWTSTTHPRAMRELCLLRDAYCVFPGCRRDSRGCDLDHITAYIPMSDGGPPGQTTPLNLAPSVPDPSPDQDLHRLGLQTPRRRHATSGPAPPDTSTKCTRLSRRPPTKNLTPPPPRPAPAGATRHARARPVVSRRSLALTPQPPNDHDRPDAAHRRAAATTGVGTPAQPQPRRPRHPVNQGARPAERHGNSTERVRARDRDQPAA